MEIKIGSPKKSKDISSVDVVVAFKIPIDDKNDLFSAMNQIKEIETLLNNQVKDVQSEAYLNSDTLVLKVK